MDLSPIEKSYLQNLKVNNTKKIGSKQLIFNIIIHIPGMRYRELLRLTRFNNGNFILSSFDFRKEFNDKSTEVREG